MDLSSYTDAARALLSPGGKYEIGTETINGVEQTVFRTAPPSLRYFFTNAVADSGTQTFLVYEEERYTFLEAWQKAQKVMQGLHRLGVRPGDRVGISVDSVQVKHMEVRI